MTMDRIIGVEDGVPVTFRQPMTEEDWLRVFAGEAKVSDFEYTHA